MEPRFEPPHRARVVFEGVDVQALVRRAAFQALLSGGERDLASLAARTGLPIDGVRAAVASLADRSLLQVDAQGGVITAAGITTRDTRHRMVVNGVDLHTMCAVDAIGIPAALGGDALVETSCERCGRPIALEVRSGRVQGGEEMVAWHPEVEPGCDVYETYCPAANLFCSLDHLEGWRWGAGDPPGRALTVTEVEELGRESWGPLA